MLATGQHPAVWVTERCGRVSVRGLDRAFGEAREAAGLPGELDLHALRHSYVTHLCPGIEYVAEDSLRSQNTAGRPIGDFIHRFTTGGSISS